MGSSDSFRWLQMASSYISLPRLTILDLKLMQANSDRPYRWITSGRQSSLPPPHLLPLTNTDDQPSSTMGSCSCSCCPFNPTYCPSVYTPYSRGKQIHPVLHAAVPRFSILLLTKSIIPSSHQIYTAKGT